MRVYIATPAPRGTRHGNRITALRWQRILSDLGCSVRVGTAWHAGIPCDLLVAIHATKSAESVDAFRRAHPDRPLVVALAGTDLYVDLVRRARTRRTIALADRLVLLQPEARAALDIASRRKSRVILQSAISRRSATSRRDGLVRIVVVGHLRAIKSPLLAARAARLLQDDSRIRVDHYGASHDDALAERARRESEANPRWTWRGERSHADLLRALSAADAYVQTSRAEGGSSAMAEAIVAGVPILSTRIAGAVGMLGRDHPGLFACDDARALSRLLARFERDPSFARRLRAASARLAPRHAPGRERDAWSALLDELPRATTSRRRSRDRPSHGRGRESVR